jgi:hypothetical protein
MPNEMEVTNLNPLSPFLSEHVKKNYNRYIKNIINDYLREKHTLHPPNSSQFLIWPIMLKNWQCTPSKYQIPNVTPIH